MGRLKAVPSRLKSAPTRLARGVASGQSRQQQRAQEKPWRKWYALKRWQDMRAARLVHCEWRCEQTGEMVIGKHPAANAPVLDHIVAHHGDPGLFWDAGNVQIVTKAWHDSVKQAMERKGQGGVPHPDWVSTSLVPVELVCGPPGSGKSTYVRERASPLDLVIDLDVIAQGFAGGSLHGWNRDEWLGPALWKRNYLIGQLAREVRHPKAWLIAGEPLAQWRQWWVDRLSVGVVTVMETSQEACVRRCADDRDTDVIAGTSAWWGSYTRRLGDVVVEGR